MDHLWLKIGCQQQTLDTGGRDNLAENRYYYMNK